jgi:hypothetical protein
MARCAYCNSETELYFANVPVCIKCGDERSPKQTHAGLVQNLADATMRADAASETFQKVIDEIPSDIPHPDGVQRIKNASQHLTKARDEMMEAHRTLDDYIERDSK